MTIQETPSRRRRYLNVITAGVLLALWPALACKHGHGLTGRWVLDSKTLDNGEQIITVLEMKQTGNELTGRVRSPGDSSAVRGTATGNHFELFGEWNEKMPYLVGDFVNGELHAIDNEKHNIIAKPGTQADEIPATEYIDPPALHHVADNDLAKTPPMGWNSWNLFAEKIDDRTVRTIADAIVSSGMRDAGYKYVNIDDTWEGVRDAQGNLQSNHKFPDMKALADYVHSKGLKLGIYSSPGPRTCAGYPASYGHEEQDAKTFAEWGVDYLKYDWCSAGSIYKNEQLQPVYQKMGDALRKSGRPIVFSLCEYGLGNVETWAPEAGGNLWRTTDDINDSWDSMIGNIERQVPATSFAGPGHWNDPDMLEIGNGHMSDDEYRTHMSLWALAAAPLLAGNDVRSMSPTTASILLNREVIAVDQDPTGRQASPTKNGELERWEKPLADGSIAVGIVNMGTSPELAIVAANSLSLKGRISRARDLWARRDVSFKEDQYSATIPSHGILLLRVWSK